jgi:CRP-like cAMP-binding protein
MQTTVSMDRAMRIMGGLVLIVLGVSVKELTVNCIMVAIIVGIYSFVTGIANFCPLAYLISVEKRNKRRKARIASRLQVSDVKELAFFRGMTGHEVEQVLSFCQLKEYAKGLTVIREGVPCKILSIIYLGSFKLVKIISKDEDKLIASLQDGQPYGEISFFDNLPPCVSVVSMEDSKVLEIDADSYAELVKENLLLGIKLQDQFLKTMSSRIRAMNEQITNLGTWVVQKRSAAWVAQNS